MAGADPAPRAVLFTDLDGTLLDHHTYRPGPAAAALRTLLGEGIEVVFCSSKTRAEQEALAARLGVRVPMVVENGGAVVLPDGTEAVLGLPYQEVRRALDEAAGRAGCSVRGYGDMSPEEVARLTGLPPEEAKLARRRRFSESFVIREGDPERLAAHLQRLGMRLSRGGRLWTAGGPHDKGTGVRYLSGAAPDAVSFGVGDSPNDAPLLRAVDVPMLVRGPDGRWAQVEVPGLLRLQGVGPEGWCEAAERVRVGPHRESWG